MCIEFITRFLDLFLLRHFSSHRWRIVDRYLLHFCNLIALGFTRIRSGSLGFDRSLERERDTRDTKNFRYKNTVVNTVFIPFYIHPPPRQYIYSSSHHGNPPWNNLTPKQYVVNFFKCRSVLSLSLSTYHSAQWTKTKLSFVEFRVIPGQSRAQ